MPNLHFSFFSQHAQQAFLFVRFSLVFSAENSTETLASQALFHAVEAFRIPLSVKPAIHLAILYADRRDRRKPPGVPGAAIAIFADRRDRRIKSPISGMSDIGD